MAKRSRVLGALDPREWARANENQRQSGLEAQVVREVARSSRDAGWPVWVTRANARNLDYGFDWLNRRCAVAFGSRKFAATRSLAVAQSQLWHDVSTEELDALADLASAYPDAPGAALVTKYCDSTRLYAYTTAPVVPTGNSRHASRFIFYHRLDAGSGEPATIVLCRLEMLLDWMLQTYGASYLHLGVTA
jgi:hypothetical protein